MMSLKDYLVFFSILLLVFSFSPLVFGAGIESDDFRASELNTSRWTIVDPLNDATIGITQNKQLVISVPAGANHDADVGGNTAPRVMQSVSGVSDFEVEVKYQTNLTASHPNSQDQGIIIEESANRFLRFDVYYAGSLKAYSSFIDGDTSHIKFNNQIYASPPIWLRVSRSGGNLWTFQYADDGQTWIDIVSFTQNLQVNKIGPYAGNYSGYWFNGQNAPMHTVLVDYFFNTNSPLDPEDGGYEDTTQPVLSNINAVAATTTATITWTTDEYASSKVIYGLIPVTYGNETSDLILKKNHQVMLTGLTPGKTYHYKAISKDTENPEVRGPDKTFSTLADNTGPDIEVWHRLSQRVGHLGNVQDDFNLMGNVSDAGGIFSLEYSLNGEPNDSLSFGNRPDGFGDGRRLAATGDFNADIPISRLNPGLNNIVLTASDMAGNVTTKSVTIDRQYGHYPFPVQINWSGITDPQQVGQYVDGKWGLDLPEGLRILRTGYDRIFLIGEKTWQDYEIKSSFIVHRIGDFDPEVFNPAVGFLMRFTGHIVGGHRNFPEAQPKWGYQPFGAIGWLVWTETTEEDFTMQFYRGDDDIWYDYGNFSITHGDKYWMKMRCETLPDDPNGHGVTRYSFKVWKDGQTEPGGWSFEQVQVSEFALRQGGVGLITHHVDVTFGNVTVNSLINNPPVITSDSLPSAEENQPYNYQVEAYDLDSGDNLNYSLTVNPDWLSINSMSGLLSGTPASADVGQENVRIVVDDRNGKSDTADFILTVSEINEPPVISDPLPALNFKEDDSLLYAISNWYPYVDDPDDPDNGLNYGVNSGKNVGAEKKSDHFMFRSAADWFGTDTLKLQVDDGEFKDSADFIITVQSVNDSPRFVNLPDSLEFNSTESFILNMGDHVEDIESADSELSYDFSVSDDHLNYQFNQETTELTLTAPGFDGTVDLTCMVSDDSTATISEIITVSVNLVQGISDLFNGIPGEYELHQNYPNPFNPETRIVFGLPKSGEVRVEVFNLIGEKIVTLWNGFKPAGYHSLSFDGRNVSSGIYFYRIRAGDFVRIRRMVFMK